MEVASEKFTRKPLCCIKWYRESKCNWRTPRDGWEMRNKASEGRGSVLRRGELEGRFKPEVLESWRILVPVAEMKSGRNRACGEVGGVVCWGQISGTFSNIVGENARTLGGESRRQM